MFDLALCLELTKCPKILLYWHALPYLNATIGNH